MKVMHYREIKTKGILNPVRGEDEWFGLTYNLNLYRGCEHQCIYCDTRSTCYQIEHFNEEVLIKINALSLLEDALPRKRKIGFIGFGSMNDPYTYAERHYQLTSKALGIVVKYRFPVHIITKSDMVLKDLDLLTRINQVKARVSFTITTTDDGLAKILEPGAPAPSRRLAAMQQLSAHGIETGVVMMPILPFIEDTSENIDHVVKATAAHDGHYIIPAFGMSIRDGQREHYYQKLDEHFPGLRDRYEKTFGNRYQCPAQNASFLAERFYEQCEKLRLQTRLSTFNQHVNSQQLALF
jgi:DNA repair photolyase